MSLCTYGVNGRQPHSCRKSVRFRNPESEQESGEHGCRAGVADGVGPLGEEDVPSHQVGTGDIRIHSAGGECVTVQPQSGLLRAFADEVEVVIVGSG